MKIAITGGHHTSALPVIDELKKKDQHIDIVWFGHKYSLLGAKVETLEYKDISSLDIEFYNLNAGKFYRTFNIKRLLKIPWGFIRAFYLLIKTKPDVILSFGGYIAAPVVFGGWLLGIPSITHEQTVVTGYANKFISNFVEKILVSWEQSKKYFPPNKVVFSGLPLREEIFSSDTSNYVIDNKLPTIYVTGGKTGSHKLNKVIKGKMEDLLFKANIIHQCGEQGDLSDYEDLKDKYKQLEDNVPGKYFVKKYVLNREIGEVFSKTDLVVSRSGAHTIKEIITLEKPALLVPIPWSSHNEQMKNARVVKKAGLAEIVEEDNLKDTFLNTVLDMLDNLNNYRLKGDEFGEPADAPEKIIVNQLFKVLKDE